MITAFKKINTSEYDTNIIQDNIEQAFNQIKSSQIIDGVLLENISLSSSQETQVAHKLGRLPRFWIVVRQNANTVVWESTSTAATTLYLTLKCSTDCTVSLWVG